jgi:hypothetical protein
LPEVPARGVDASFRGGAIARSSISRLTVPP